MVYQAITTRYLRAPRTLPGPKLAELRAHLAALQIRERILPWLRNRRPELATKYRPVGYALAEAYIPVEP